MSTWQEQRRRERVAAAEQKRADAKTAAEVEAIRARAEAEAEAVRAAAMADAARQAERDRRAAQRQAQRDKQATRDRRRAQGRQARRAAVQWVGGHVTEVFIYGIALVSFVMAAPAMAAYGHDIYTGGSSALPFTGALLPVITELGMWASAFAVHRRRRVNPGASVVWLQAGVAVFAAGAVALNVLHGLTVRWDAAVVMGFVSVAGVLLHQLAVAAPPRTRADRAQARLARRAERKTEQAQRAAIKDATIELDAAGRARLVFEPGVYHLGRTHHADRLRPATNPLDRPGARDAMDDAIAALIDTETTRAGQHTGHQDDGGQDLSGGGVATLDRPRSETWSHSNGPAQTPFQGRARFGGRRARSLDQLRAELAALIERDPQAVDPSSASSIAKALRCRKDTARALRDEINTHPDRKGDW